MPIPIHLPIIFWAVSCFFWPHSLCSEHGVSLECSQKTLPPLPSVLSPLLLSPWLQPAQSGCWSPCWLPCSNEEKSSTVISFLCSFLRYFLLKPKCYLATQNTQHTSDWAPWLHILPMCQIPPHNGLPTLVCLWYGREFLPFLVTKHPFCHKDLGWVLLYFVTQNHPRTSDLQSCTGPLIHNSIFLFIP